MSANSKPPRRKWSVMERPPSLDELDEKELLEDDGVADDDDNDISEDLPSFKSVIYTGTSTNNSKKCSDKTNNEGDLFFDSQQCKWVKVDNFAFSEGENHFEKSDTSSLAILDSKILDEEGMSSHNDNDEQTKQILDDFFESVRRNDNQPDPDPGNLSNRSGYTNSSSQPNSSLDVSFDDGKHQRPKIHSTSPREVTPPRKFSLRKLSSKEEVLPSRTPREDFVTGGGAVSSSSSSSMANNNNSKIPRFVRRQRKSGSTSSPVQKKLGGSQMNTMIDRSAKKLGQNRSHSATNLNKLSVRDYHGSFQLRRRSASDNVKSSSCDSLNRLKMDLAGKKCDYSHVKSKVRQYIEAGQKPRVIKKKSSKQSNVLDVYGKSFVLSPGRKSLSMSNIAADADAEEASRRTSTSSTMFGLKSFLSTKHLDDLSVTVKSKNGSKSRDSLTIANDKVSKLLDFVSDEEEEGECITEEEDPEVVFGVEDLLKLAMNERRDKQQAKKVLAELQTNYDNLQRRFAAAETTIDRLRFGDSFKDDTTGFQEQQQQQNLSYLQTCQQRKEVNNLLQSQSQSQDFELSLEKLLEIKEQLYGLELLSAKESTLTPMDRQKALAKMRTAYEGIHESTMNALRTNTKQTDQEQAVELTDLLQKVGEKLCVLELQECASLDDEAGPEDYREFLAGLQQNQNSRDAIADEALGPLEKVAQWKITDNVEAVQEPSGYGSNSTSPTPIVNNKPNCSERSSFEQVSPGDLDSGCPGSERSVRGPPYFPANNHGHHASGLHRNLSNVEEELLVKDDQVKDNGKSRHIMVATEEPVPNFHTETDLSSDEGDIRLQQGKQIHSQKIDDEIENLKLQVAASTPKKNDPAESSSHNSTLVVTPNMKLKIPTQSPPRGSTMILAQQIDQEIVELRNFFEDHREEMISLLNSDTPMLKTNLNQTTSTGCSPIVFDNLPSKNNRSLPATSTVCPKSPRRRSSNSRKVLQDQAAAFVSDSDCHLDILEERRQEFERFKMQKKQRKSSSKERKNNSATVEPQFAIGQPASERRISSLFPKVEDEVDGQGAGGKHIPTADGDHVFIPKLSLEDQFSDASIGNTNEDGNGNPDDKVQPFSKSFDFYMDEADEQDHDEVDDVPQQHRVDRGCQTPMLPDPSGLEHEVKEKVIIVQKCCHAKEKSKKHKNKKSSKKNRQNLVDLLQSLKTANEMASNMKKRSLAMLDVIGDEINSCS